LESAKCDRKFVCIVNPILQPLFIRILIYTSIIHATLRYGAQASNRSYENPGEGS